MALALSKLLPPLQNVALPVMFAEGGVPAATTNGAEVKEQPLLFTIVIVYAPPTEAVYEEEFAPIIGDPLRFH